MESTHPLIALLTIVTGKAGNAFRLLLLMYDTCVTSILCLTNTLL